MKISYNWLCNYIGNSLQPKEIAELLTDCGLEVESSESYQSVKGGLSGVVVGRVLSCVQHPGADRLRLTRVDVGAENPLRIVCGAPNVAEGQTVLVATVGCTLYPASGEPLKITKSKIRGEVSEGMICAEDELGIGESHDGILVLNEELPPGTAAAKALNLYEDIIFEIGLTPNRSDAASHLGVAQDLVAVLAAKGKELSLNCPAIKPIEKTSQLPIEIDVQHEDCPRYSGIVLDQVKVGDSPEWLQNYLKAIGLRPINNVVDITNYILHETGQPLHAFNYDAIQGHKVVVKKFDAETRFTTLDGVERTLSPNDLMICNATEPMCIAGVYGGLQSGVNNETTRVFIESAYFAAGSIRKTSKHHGLKTDASYRYERGADPEITLFALQRAVNLMVEHCGASVASDLLDHYPVKIQSPEITVNWNYLNTITGVNFSAKEVGTILLALRFTVKEETTEYIKVIPPSNKVDVTRPIDVAEEVLRIYGYNRVPLPEKLHMAIVHAAKPNKDELLNAIRRHLIPQGFFEVMNNSLSASKIIETLAPDKVSQLVMLKNPLSSELNAMRSSLLFGLLDNLAYNRNRQRSNLRLFELGKVYQLINGKYNESLMLGMLIHGAAYDESWALPAIKNDYTFLKGTVTDVLNQSRINATTKPGKADGLTDVLEWEVKGKTLFSLGRVDERITRYFDLEGDYFYAEASVDALLKHQNSRPVKFTELPKYPEVKRDLALLLPNQTAFADIEKLAHQAEKNLLKEVSLFDVYEGKNIPEGKKSYAVSFTLQNPNATLNDKQIEKVMEKLMETYVRQLGAEIRK
jgi:phenylalanyl-tRNA synthetase beta chain